MYLKQCTRYYLHICIVLYVNIKLILKGLKGMHKLVEHNKYKIDSVLNKKYNHNNNNNNVFVLHG